MKHTPVVTCAGALQMFVTPNVRFNTIYDWWVIYHACITSNPPTRISWHHTRCRDSHPRRIEPRSGTQPTTASPCFTVNSLDKYWERSLIYKDVCVVFWTRAFTYLIRWHAKLSIRFESISGSAKKTFAKSKWRCSFQAEGRVWKRRKQMLFNRNVQAYERKTPSYSYTSTHTHNALSVFAHTEFNLETII